MICAAIEQCIEVIIVESSLTQTRETRDGHKCLMDGDITTVNCDYPTGGERFFHSTHTRTHRRRAVTRERVSRAERSSPHLMMI